jgi:hypothetical protein
MARKNIKVMISSILRRNRIRTLTKFFLLTSITLSSFGQSNLKKETCIPKPDIYNGQELRATVEKMPEFPGGEGELNTYIKKNLKFRDKDSLFLQTRVNVTFIIDTIGKAVEPCIFRSVYKDFTPLEIGTIKVIENMPLWSPGMQDSKKIPVRYTLPIIVELR